MSKATSNSNITSSNNTGNNNVNTNAPSFGMGIKIGVKRNTNTEEPQQPVVQERKPEVKGPWGRKQV
jgi:hypothetical protein